MDRSNVMDGLSSSNANNPVSLPYHSDEMEGLVFTAAHAEAEIDYRTREMDAMAAMFDRVLTDAGLPTGTPMDFDHDIDVSREYGYAPVCMQGALPPPTPLIDDNFYEIESNSMDIDSTLYPNTTFSDGADSVLGDDLVPNISLDRSGSEVKSLDVLQAETVAELDQVLGDYDDEDLPTLEQNPRPLVHDSEGSSPQSSLLPNEPVGLSHSSSPLNSDLEGLGQHHGSPSIQSRQGDQSSEIDTPVRDDSTIQISTPKEMAEPQNSPHESPSTSPQPLQSLSYRTDSSGLSSPPNSSLFESTPVQAPQTPVRRVAFYESPETGRPITTTKKFIKGEAMSCPVSSSPANDSISSFVGSDILPLATPPEEERAQIFAELAAVNQRYLQARETQVQLDRQLGVDHKMEDVPPISACSKSIQDEDVKNTHTTPASSTPVCVEDGRLIQPGSDPIAATNVEEVKHIQPVLSTTTPTSTPPSYRDRNALLSTTPSVRPLASFLRHPRVQKLSRSKTPRPRGRPRRRQGGAASAYVTTADGSPMARQSLGMDTCSPLAENESLSNARSDSSPDDVSSNSSSDDSPIDSGKVLEAFGNLRVSGRRASARERERHEREAEEKARKEREEQEERERMEKEAEEERKKLGLRPMPKNDIIPALSNEWDRKVDDAMAKTRDTVLAKTSTGTEVRRYDMGKVLPQPGASYDDRSGWLNDVVISAYLQLLVDQGMQNKELKRGETPRYHAFNSFFFKNLTEKGPKSVERWATRAKIGGKRLYDVETIFIPVNVSGNHWTLLTISPKLRKIEFWDSFHSSAERYGRLALDWLRQELGSAFDAEEWKVVTQDDGKALGPTQYNASDCGVFAITTAKCLLFGVDPMCYSAAEMQLQRRRVVAELLAEGFSGGEELAVEW